LRHFRDGERDKFTAETFSRVISLKVRANISRRAFRGWRVAQPTRRQKLFAAWFNLRILDRFSAKAE
jgi:hypothetical protein